MTKFFKFASFAILAGACVACSDKLDEVAPEKAPSAFDEEGNGFLKIAINLPTTTSAGTRAIGDKGDNYGEFNDGEKYEYAVENAILVLFTGTGDNEATYTFQSAYQLSSGEWNMDGSTQITSNRTFVQQINNAGATGKLYAYVILNKHNFFEVNNGDLLFTCGQGDHVNFSLKNHTCTTHTLPTNISFGEFEKLAINESGRRYDQNCFLMTNMPYASQPGGASTPDPATIVMKSLYPVNTSAIYASRTEAELGAAATEVNVERVLAKVETSWTYPAGKDYFETEDGNAYHAEILGWFIDNTNKTAYVARNFDAPDGVGLDYLAYQSERTNVYSDTPWLYTTKSHRFVSGAAVTDGAYRTFWAIDPNYNAQPAVSGKKDDAAVIAATDALINEGGEFVNNTLMKYDASGNNIGGRLRANGSAYYCTENTFDVEHQSHYNTTRVVVAADFGDAFYTIAQEAGKQFSESAIINYTKARIAERVHFMQWVEEYYVGANAVDLIDVTLNNHGGKAGAAEVTISNVPDGLTAANVKGGTPEALADAKAAWKLNVDDPSTGDNVFLANNFHINYYKDGVAYYSALIKHFGDYETPWYASWYAGQENTVSGVYDTTGGVDFDAQSYLGRYGVVRNNWYNIDVTGIRQIGSAVVPVLPGTEPDTPDDQVENYLKVKINITPWAIRKQSVIL